MWKKQSTHRRNIRKSGRVSMLFVFLCRMTTENGNGNEATGPRISFAHAPIGKYFHTSSFTRTEFRLLSGRHIISKHAWKEIKQKSYLQTLCECSNLLKEADLLGHSGRDVLLTLGTTLKRHPQVWAVQLKSLTQVWKGVLRKQTKTWLKFVPLPMNVCWNKA